MIEGLTVCGEMDERTLEQAAAAMAAEEGSIGSVSPDNHLGYNSHPVGFTLATRTSVSASGVGVDIACGNKAAGTGIQVADLAPGELKILVDDIWREVDFGIGLNQSAEVDHPVVDAIRDSPAEFQRALAGKAQNQLGSTGGGNHYVDLFEDRETGELVVGVHFGSRGLGHATCEHYVKEQGAFAPPTMIAADSPEGEEYLEAMRVCGEYAYAGRDVVVQKVLDILCVAAPAWEVHNHHNFAWRERHFGEDFWVVRKGCTPAFPGQAGFVGSTMGEDSVTLEGRSDGDAVGVANFQEEMLFSTVHGAGRAMSRGKAAGRKKKRWTCCNRDCDWVQPPFTHKPADGACPACRHPRLQKRWVQLETGVIDWEAEQEKVAGSGIELRGGAADEAPGAYKRLDEVLEAAGDTISVTRTLRPVAVLMAPSHVASDD
jgi:tRNA-splicing ligase RtcB